MSKYQLEFDESVIMRKEGVYVDGSLDCIADVISLTTQNLVIEYTTGFFDDKSHVDKYPLSDIKLYKSVPQVKMGEHDGVPVLEIYFSNAQLLINFREDEDEKSKMCIDAWVSKIIDTYSDLTEGNSAGSIIKNNGTKICKTCGKEISENAAFCSFCGTKALMEIVMSEEIKICKICGKAISQGVNYCTECGSAVEDDNASLGVLDVKQPDSAPNTFEDSPKDKLSIEQQIDLLQKLKSFVDAGIISQEEFEKKKKEIL